MFVMGREFHTTPSGKPDELVPIPVPIEDLPVSVKVDPL